MYAYYSTHTVYEPVHIIWIRDRTYIMCMHSIQRENFSPTADKPGNQQSSPQNRDKMLRAPFITTTRALGRSKRPRDSVFVPRFCDFPFENLGKKAAGHRVISQLRSYNGDSPPRSLYAGFGTHRNIIPADTPDYRPLSNTAIHADSTTDAESSIYPSGEQNSLQDPPFSKVLIANRGEIALRIIQTCRALGIDTVAVYSTIDVRAPHVLAADEAVCLGPAPTSESYLNIDAVCDAIRKTGAQAVHPGYGFLSENADFAQRVTEMGVSFVGPSSAAIVAMGDKIQSKKIARDAMVDVIPGYDGIISGPDHAVQIAEEVVYPVMIKASAGGGGKGMRICRTPEEVREGYQLSRAEAKSFFGDERLFIERYVEDPHHIEFQVLSGRRRIEHGDDAQPIQNETDDGPLEILVFPERECSIQRRNQKVIEESPSCLLTSETRALMAKQVRSLVRSVDYESAGTIEFLVDEEQNFYFLEMNTRLQVEHPITEMVTGNIDLVAGMFDVAAGRGVPEEYLALSDGEDDGAIVSFSGHAIEARIYAENPLRGFLPSTGSLLQYIEPPEGSMSMAADESENDDTDAVAAASFVRIDSGVVAGYPITPYYDPMISKLCTYSTLGRAEAIDALADALDRYVISGVENNTSFIRDVLRQPAFQAGETPTNFIENHYSEGFCGVDLNSQEKTEMAVIAAALGGWRMALLDQPPLTSGIDEDDGIDDELVVCLGGMFGEAYAVSMAGSDNGSVTVRLLGPEGEGSEVREMDVLLGDYDANFPVIEVSIDGIPRAIQVR